MKNDEENFNENIFDYNNQDNDILDEDFFKDDVINKDSERLTIEKYERACLEKKSNKYKKSAILFGIAAGLWGLCAILNSKRLLVIDDPSFRLQLNLLMDLSWFGFYSMSSYESYNSMKKTNKKIEETRGYSM